jgi:hypothetical protein
LLRRTFGAFAGGERRAIGERIAAGPGGSAAGASARGRATQATVELDHDRAAGTLPTLSALLGRNIQATGNERQAATGTDRDAEAMR